MEQKTILIVDDHADTRLLLSAHLKAHYRTVFAAVAPPGDIGGAEGEARCHHPA
jgi:CheY-like chemotaxis protein